ncbi:type ISP restriction/modification enzyme [Desulfovibrio sp. TomC]|uniref:type ISP restriction/modification enzyme n=1 Tax=Desulfovibrio sp. TomC TaxID=1562888 RepID=UPI000573927A|nr:type ISP restriction/modification enzyme [Desulfovibrio sp. TomC]KHK00379.1 Helicase domain protein [Desulfovibrio sp. TomC]
MLHSPDYRERYADNLTKELPRIPCVKTTADYWAFSKTGRAIAHWHLRYETIERYPLVIQGGGVGLTDADYRVARCAMAKRKGN